MARPAAKLARAQQIPGQLERALPLTPCPVLLAPYSLLSHYLTNLLSCYLTILLAYDLTTLLSYSLTILQEGLLDASPPGGAPGGAAGSAVEDAAPDSARVLWALEATPGVLSALIEQGMLPTGDDAKLLQQLREMAAASKDGPLQAPPCFLWPYSAILTMAILTMANLTMATLAVAMLTMATPGMPRATAGAAAAGGILHGAALRAARALRGGGLTLTPTPTLTLTLALALALTLTLTEMRWRALSRRTATRCPTRSAD